MFGLDDAFMFIQNREDVEENNNAARQFANSQQQQNFDFQTLMDNSKWQRTVTDLRTAGLNPMLAYQQGPGHAPSGGIAGASTGQPSIGRGGVTAGLQTASQIAVNDAVEDRTRAEAEEIRARTPTHQVTIEKMRQDINESIERIFKLQQDTKTSASSAAHLDQSTRNLQATIPQIDATVNNLIALTKQAGALTGKTVEETNEIRQRVKENLPALIAALDKLKARHAKGEAAQGERKAELYEGKKGDEPQLGALAEFIRAFNPIQGLFK